MLSVSALLAPLLRRSPLPEDRRNTLADFYDRLAQADLQQAYDRTMANVLMQQDRMRARSDAILKSVRYIEWRED